MSGQMADPLTVACSYCGAHPRMTCRTARVFRKPHAARRRLALSVAAHADPALDGHFADSGPCGICGVPGLGARHRVIDAIAGWIEADPEVSDEDLAGEYGVSEEAIRAVRSWMERWPGAWG